MDLDTYRWSRFSKPNTRKYLGTLNVFENPAPPFHVDDYPVGDTAAGFSQFSMFRVLTLIWL
jgi:hypothetical protein